MGKFFKIGNQAIIKDNINEVGLYTFEFPLMSKMSNAEIVTAMLSELNGKEYFKYNILKCNVLYVKVCDVSGSIDHYIFHNSDNLCSAINSANERRRDGKISDSGYCATDYDRKLYELFINSNITFVYSDKDINELFEKITE